MFTNAIVNKVCVVYMAYKQVFEVIHCGEVGYTTEENKKLIRRWDSQTWLHDIGGDMPDSPV